MIFIKLECEKKIKEIHSRIYWCELNAKLEIMFSYRSTSTFFCSIIFLWKFKASHLKQQYAYELLEN